MYSIQITVYMVKYTVSLPLSKDSVGEGPLPLQGDDDHRVDGAGDQDVLGTGVSWQGG